MAHQAACTPGAACDAPPHASLVREDWAGEGVTGSTGGKYKLLKYLTNGGTPRMALPELQTPA